jgi:hypothetical protein
VITVVLSFCLSLVPIVLAVFKLPGNMVLAANNSAVISAACHAVPTETAIDDMLGAESRYSNPRPLASANVSSEYVLREMSRRELGWGVVSTGRGTAAEPGHLAFGTPKQIVDVAVVGEYYAGASEKVD